MVERVTVGRRGAMTLPASLRKQFGIREADDLLIEATEEGILLRPAAILPLEIYSEARIAEFLETESEVAAQLARPGAREKAKGAPKP